MAMHHIYFSHLTPPGFADATYSLTERLSLTGGVRYTDERKQFNNAFSVTIPEIHLVVVGPIPCVLWGD
jgi:hypothetical protein